MRDYQVITWQDYLAYTRTIKALAMKGEVSAPRLPQFIKSEHGTCSMATFFAARGYNLSLAFGGIACYQSKSIILREGDSVLFRRILSSTVRLLRDNRQPDREYEVDLWKLINSSSISAEHKAHLVMCLHRLYPKGGTFGRSNSLFEDLNASLLNNLSRLILQTKDCGVIDLAREPERTLISTIQDELITVKGGCIVEVLPKLLTVVMLRSIKGDHGVCQTLCVCRVTTLGVMR